jgi:hypothetical protein
MKQPDLQCADSELTQIRPINPDGTKARRCLSSAVRPGYSCQMKSYQEWGRPVFSEGGTPELPTFLIEPTAITE